MINKTNKVIKKNERGNGNKENSFDVILLQTELESGLTKETLKSLLSKLENDFEYIPFTTSENNSSAHGFVKRDTLEELNWNEKKIGDFVKRIIGDLDMENEDNVYMIDSNIKAYIGYA